MSDPENELGPEVDVQVGAHDVDTEPISFGGDEDDENFIKFQFEAETVFKRLADDIYESPAAGIREPLTNSVTAIFRAVSEGYIDRNRGTIEITLEEDSEGGWSLIIRDNGIGISEAEIKQVLSVIGRSTSRDIDELAGQFGMGFLSMYKLTGTDGGFIMHTRSRRTDELTSGVWKSGGFSRSPNGLGHRELGEGEYGTKFVIPLRDTISDDDIRDWVEAYAEFSRVPVIYREFDANGSEVFNEDYGDKRLEDSIDPNHEYEYVVYEDEYFRAVSAKNSHNRTTLLLDVPINRQVRYIDSAPWKRSVMVRLKTENPIVVEGPNEGLRPVSEPEYREMDEERQKRYIPESRLHNDDIVLPGPIGTRDTLAPAEDFWQYVGNKLTEVYKEKATDIFEKLDTPDDIADLTEPEADFLINEAIPRQDDYDYDEFKRNLRVTYDTVPNDEVTRALSLMNQRVSVAPREATNISRKKNRREYPVVRVMVQSQWGEFGSDDRRDGDVYMGVSLNDWKTEAAHKAHPKNVVLAVDGTEWYDIFGDVFGWKKLKDIRKSNLDELGLSEDEQEEVLSIKGGSTETVTKNLDGEKVKIHMDDESRHLKLSKLKEGLENLASGDSPSEAWGSDYNATPRHGVVAVPLSAENNLPDVEWVQNENYGVVALSSDEWDYLEGTPRVYHADEFEQTVEQRELVTSEGKMSVRDAKNKGNLVVHTVPEEHIDYYRSDEKMSLMAKMIEQEPWYNDRRGFRSGSSIDANVIYAPVTKDEAVEVGPALDDAHYACDEATYRPNVGSRVYLPDDAQLYLLLELPNWWGSEQLQFIERRVASDRGIRSTDEKFATFVRMLKDWHDEGYEPPSEPPKI